MNTFISDSVKALYNKYGDKISEINILLPSRRAQLFFNIELSKLCENRAIWQPHYQSIDSLCEEITSMKIANKIKLLIELHKSYSAIIPESFDSFYYWGEMLLADFDTVDNYKIDAKRLFCNVKELGDIDTLYSDVAIEQREFIENFWRSINQKGGYSNEQVKFLKVWEVLYDVYRGFRSSLLEQRIAYKGMIYRLTTELLDERGEECFGGKSIAVVGFNALSRCEKEILLAIKERSDSSFLWDYDNFYTTHSPKHDAGLFVRENIELFGEFNPEQKENYRQPKEINVIETPTDSIQCKYVWEFLDSCQREAMSQGREIGRETAIVLTDESLLIPVLHSIPASVKNFNITAGYPLSKTSIYNLFEYLVRLHNNVVRRDGRELYYLPDIEQILAHPAITDGIGTDRAERVKEFAEKRERLSSRIELSELLELEIANYLLPKSGSSISEFLGEAISGIGTAYYTTESANKVTVESLATISRVIAQSINLFSEVEMSDSVFVSALRKSLRNAKVTFQGEPLIGVQVMGILETRNLDFENLLILSLNDDNYPGSLVRSSFIPNSLRVGFSLPARSHQEAMYCYYFYRLIQRTKRADILYSGSSEGTRSGEVSRYISQIHYAPEHKITAKSLSVRTDNKAPIDELRIGAEYRGFVEKIMDGSKTVSPSMIGEWIKCRRSFYYHYVMGIRVDQKATTEIGTADFGTAVHHTLETIYQRVIGAPTSEAKAILKQSLADIDKILEEWLEKKYEINEETNSLRSTMKFAHQYIRNVVNWDIQRTDNFVIKELEKRISGSIVVKSQRGEFSAKLFGIIDRFETIDGKLDLLSDYKTGARSNVTNNIEALFSPDNKPNKPFMQSLYYCYLHRKASGRDVAPALLFTKYMGDVGYNPSLTVKSKSESYTIENFAESSDDYLCFEESLANTIRDIVEWDDEVVKQTSIEQNCEYCSYRRLCLK